MTYMYVEALQHTTPGLVCNGNMVPEPPVAVDNRIPTQPPGCGD